MPPYNRIAAYGIELEGAWPSEPANAVHDGSIDGLEDYGYMGEVPSPILRSLESVATWIRSNFYEASNDSCGMHVHMSFKNMADYALLMDDIAFQEYILDGLRDWADDNSHISSDHPIYDRLNGINDMCELNWCPSKQATSNCKGPERYNVLNFCYELHSTLEVRVLPAFDDYHSAIDAVETLSRLVNAWLKHKRKRKLKKISMRLVMANRHREKDTLVLSNLRDLDPTGWQRGRVEIVNGTLTVKEESEVTPCASQS